MARSSSRDVALIGLGLIGSRLARRLLDSGWVVRGYDTDAQRRLEFARAGGIPTGSPEESVAGCHLALLSLPDSDVAREVCLGGLCSSDSRPLYVYDTTTGRPEDSVQIAAALDKEGITYCDATLSGNSEMAERGELIVMVGGPVEAYREGVGLFEVLGRAHHHLGEVGSGARMKLLVNHVLAIHRLALAESLVVAELAGMEPASTLEVLRDSAAYSRAMDVWGERMATGMHDAPASRLTQGAKDSRLILDHAASLGAPVGLMEVVGAVLAEGQAAGLGDLDNSAVVEVLRRRVGRGRVAG